MKTYRFETKTTMKPYNESKYWIDRDYVGNAEFKAETLSEAISKWVERCDERGVTVTKTAIKEKEAMYIDTKDGESIQVGYVITGMTDILDDVKRRYTQQYIDLWVTIKEVSYIDFETEVA